MRSNHLDLMLSLSPLGNTGTGSTSEMAEFQGWAGGPSDSSKTVLACLEERKRQQVDGTTTEEEALRDAILSTYEDVLPQQESASTLILQLKCADWEGEFVDLQDQVTPDHSVINMVVSGTEVCDSDKCLCYENHGNLSVSLKPS